MRDEHLPLDALATRLNLPRTFLRGLANKGILPRLNINGKLRFSGPAAREALRKLADQKDGGAS